jgi:hypothetical protein
MDGVYAKWSTGKLKTSLVPCWVLHEFVVKLRKKHKNKTSTFGDWKSQQEPQDYIHFSFRTLDLSLYPVPELWSTVQYLFFTLVSS